MLLSSVEGVVRDLEFLGYEMVNSSEYVGGDGLHFGIHQYLNDDDLLYISDTLKGYLK